MIRLCQPEEATVLLAIINDAARAYQGIIPADRWREPYMPPSELLHEMEQGVLFWGAELQGRLLGVMGIQDKGQVTLIRHAYVRTACRNQGIGSALLRHLESLAQTKPILVGTWSDATWAIAFYQKHGYQLTSPQETRRLLKTYWSIPERQVETSVVLIKEPQANN